MAKLHQILAVERDVKQTSDRRITDVYHQLQKAPLLVGIDRSYQPIDDEGEHFPSETTRVQVRTQEALKSSADEFERLWDLVATKDFGNTEARADVVLKNGTVLVEAAPATYLLWLEKQLNDIRTIFSKLPTLDPSEEWEFSAEHDCYVTPPVQTHKSKKIPRAFVKAEATDKHPAQVDVWQEDVLVGYWTTVKSSGAIPASEQRQLLDRVLEVLEAVKVARTNANDTEVAQQKIARQPLQFIFGTQS